jgi:uncharacterized protein (TIRG00374 family)
MKKQLIFAAEFVFTLIVIGVILFLVDIHKVWETVLNANIYFFLAGALAYVMIAFLMAFRLKYVLQEMGHKITMRSAIVSNFAGLLLSDFTPARSGYLGTAFMVSHKEKIPLEKTSVAVLAPQLFEFMLKVTIGTVAIIFIATQFNNGGLGDLIGMAAAVAVVFGMLTFGVLLLFSKRFLKLLSIAEMIPVVGKWGYALLVKMHDNTLAVKRAIPVLIVLMFSGWAFKSLEWVLLAHCLGLEPDTTLPIIVFYGFFQPLVTLLQFVPTPTLAGIGLSEAGAAAIFLLFGVPPHQSVTFLLLTRFDTVLMDLFGVQEARQIVRKYLNKLL